MTKKNIKTTTAALIAFFSLFFGSKYFKTNSDTSSSAMSNSIEDLYQKRKSGVMVQFNGVVIKKLSDDNEGSRHQRFIVQLNSRHTVLIAHNIDLAPRVPIGLNKSVAIYGQYEWNERGGVIHWTHKDPGGTHEEGWIKYQGKTYH